MRWKWLHNPPLGGQPQTLTKILSQLKVIIGLYSSLIMSSELKFHMIDCGWSNLGFKKFQFHLKVFLDFTIPGNVTKSHGNLFWDTKLMWKIRMMTEFTSLCYQLKEIIQCLFSSLFNTFGRCVLKGLIVACVVGQKAFLYTP